MMKKILLPIMIGFAVNCVAQTGNVGIGTSTPQAQLEVVNSIRFGGIGKYITYDSITGTFQMKNSHLQFPDNQFLFKYGSGNAAMQHSNGFLNFHNVNGVPMMSLNTNTDYITIPSKLGIGISSSAYPLTFASALGDKISLFGSVGSHYGFGIQNQLLQIYSDQSISDIAFGYGSSTSFTERMRIKGNGNVGIANTNPIYRLDVNGDSRIIGRVAIGDVAHNAPLTFPGTVGKKITLYKGATSDYGISIQSGVLQLYSDAPIADVAFGYEQAGVVTERFRVRGNGVLRVNGNDGSQGQLLASNGNASAAAYKNLGSIDVMPTYQKNLLSSFVVPAEIYVVTYINDITHTITLTKKSRLMISANVSVENPCSICTFADGSFTLYINNQDIYGMGVSAPANRTSNATFSNYMYDLLPGTHTIKFGIWNRENVEIRILNSYSSIIVLPID